MPVDAYASEWHYFRHLCGVWDALPAEMRGTFWLGPRLATNRSQMPPPALMRQPGNRVLVASYQDDVAWRGRRIIDMNHGAGQSYSAEPEAARHPSYAGGDRRERVDLFLVPGPHPAQRCRGRWAVPVVEIGCPALDAAHENGWTRDPANRPAEPTVAVSFHWENALCPETRSAFHHFLPGLPALAKAYRLIGHCHPRAEYWARPVFDRIGIPWASYDEVMAGADAVVVDNSSLGFEAVACGKALVWMTPPTYRDLPHGLRFGPERNLGVECRDPASLADAVAEALTRSPSEALLDAVYTHRGDAARRAAEAICALEAAGLEAAAC